MYVLTPVYSIFEWPVVVLFFLITFCRYRYIQYFEWRPTITDIQIADIQMVGLSIALLLNTTGIFDIWMDGDGGIFDIWMAGDGILVVFIYSNGRS